MLYYRRSKGREAEPRRHRSDAALRQLLRRDATDSGRRPHARVDPMRQKNDLVVRYTLGKGDAGSSRAATSCTCPVRRNWRRRSAASFAGSGAAGRAYLIAPVRSRSRPTPSPAFTVWPRRSGPAAHRDRVDSAGGSRRPLAGTAILATVPEAAERLPAGGARDGSGRRAPAAVDRRRRPVPILLSEARSATAEPVPSLPWVRRRNRRSNVDFGPSSARGPTCSCGAARRGILEGLVALHPVPRAARCGETWRGDSAPADRLTEMASDDTRRTARPDRPA